jgi:hypothetical protein
MGLLLTFMIYLVLLFLTKILPGNEIGLKKSINNMNKPKISLLKCTNQIKPRKLEPGNKIGVITC